MQTDVRRRRPRPTAVIPQQSTTTHLTTTQNELQSQMSPSSCEHGHSDEKPQPQGTTIDSSTRTLTFRFCIVWTARLLLPIVYLLSTAKLVVIPSSSSSTATTATITSSESNIGHTSAILVITHSRELYLERTLQSLLRYHPGDDLNSWPIFVSRDEQDGRHSSLDGVLQRASEIAQSRNIALTQWSHNMTYSAASNNIEDENENENENEDEDVDQLRFINVEAYARISRHYRWALQRTFDTGVQRLVVVEDDLQVAPDFYTYFSALAPMLDIDPTLICISAWNDNGISSLSLNVTRLHRTDFFPGLGWMLTHETWKELSSKWPKRFWDDWLRRPTQMQGRQCIRPEVSRTANFGEDGVSKSFHFDKYVSKVTLATKYVNFMREDLSYLDADTYFHNFFTRFSNATRLKFSNYLTSRNVDSDVIAFYPNGKLEAISKRTGIMSDHRWGIRRTSYHGVISFPWRGHWAFVVERGWTPPEGYEIGARECC